MEKITFKTKDGVTIAGNYFKPVEENPPAFLLLHMMPATKESWNTFASHLQKEGFAVLAIDLRGHGESTDRNGKKIDYKMFSDEDHRESINDIAAAKEFLRQNGADTSRMAIGGASIGANLALWHASEDKDVRLLVLLSAGLNYRGIKTPELAARFSGPVYILVSENDSKAIDGSKKIFEIFPGDKKLNIIKGNSHGTDMFASMPGLLDELLGWVVSKLKQ